MNLFVPGRICLLGEHSDWAGGYRKVAPSIEKGFAILSGTNQGVFADVQAHPTSLVLNSVDHQGHKSGPIEIPMELNTLLLEAQKGGFWSYIAGVAYHVMTNFQVGGLVINNYRTDLPIKKGLSSSAAICVLTARAFNRIYDLKLTTRGEMELAYLGETLTPSRCGRMDQGCAFGSRPVLMTFDGDRLETTKLQVKKDFHFVLVDLNASKNTQLILQKLNNCYPVPDSEQAQNVQNLFGSLNRHFIHEAIDHLKNGNDQALGKLMSDAQASFDQFAIPVCPEELTAPTLHQVLKYERIQPHIWGGKGVGSQGDGSAQILARSKEDQEIVSKIIEEDFNMACLNFTLQPGQRVRKAVIPAAGFGTRLFPASKATKKELFPVIDRDGIAKPAILLIVEEALQAGIEEVIIVIQEDDLDDFRNLFYTPVSTENHHKLSPAAQDYARRILEMGQKVTFVVQKNQEGFGHAVYCTRPLIKDEPFLLMLGDHIYRSNTNASCAKQLIEAFQKFDTSIVGLRPTPAAQISNFGTVTGVWIQDHNILKISEFAEKPDIDYAQEHLHIPEFPENQFLTLFGQYIIKPEVFDYLEENIRSNVREKGEFQLTNTLEKLRQIDGFHGVVIDGNRFDIGIPDYYLQTLIDFRKP